MRYYIAAILLGSVVLGAVTTSISGLAQWLDAATARQCATRDWPANKAAATEAWCRKEGYSVGTTRPTGEFTGP